jgi:hypothetical protein
MVLVQLALHEPISLARTRPGRTAAAVPPSIRGLGNITSSTLMTNHSQSLGDPINSEELRLELQVPDKEK